MGNLARDPDVRYTASKQKVARMTVACGRQWKDKNGELQSHTDFVAVTVWGNLADICERYLRKGRPVLVEGRISVRDYDDPKSGQKRWITEVVADNLVLLGGRRDEEGGGYEAPSRSVPAAGRPARAAAAGPVDAASLRDEADFGEFPLDISDVSEAGGGDDVDIPF
jgi:single-strand DNA-binding protein